MSNYVRSKLVKRIIYMHFVVAIVLCATQFINWINLIWFLGCALFHFHFLCALCRPYTGNQRVLHKWPDRFELALT